MKQKATETFIVCFLICSILVPVRLLKGNPMPGNVSKTPIFQQPVISIARARQLGAGTTVSVAGRVTESIAFDGPVFIQDATAGIAVYDPSLLLKVRPGDSLRVNGTLTDYHSLLEISGNISYSIVPSKFSKPAPRSVTVSSVGENLEGQLVVIKQARFNVSGIFQPDHNYQIYDASGTMTLRIDANTDIVDKIIPTEPVDITGIINEYDNTYELMPRTATDVSAKTYVPPGSSIPSDRTFNIVTWNIEWFGDPGQNPANDSLQIANTATVIKHINADLYALQEISNAASFRHLLKLLPGYRGFMAPYKQTQKTAFLYRTTVIDSVRSGLIEPAGVTDWNYNWANGRPPFQFIFRATIDGVTRQLDAIDIHAKATSNDPPTDYQRRQQASKELKQYLDSNMGNASLILLGDYNDDVDVSTFDKMNSPYSNFMADRSHYKVITSSLSRKKFVSEIHGDNMIDHITISNELFTSYFDSTATVDDISYIPGFSSTTSDHYPVEARLQFKTPNAASPGTANPQKGSYLNQNYPNPFNITTNIMFHLDKSLMVTLNIFNLLGQRVATLINHQTMNQGDHIIPFQSNGLPSGIYFYRLEPGNEPTLTRKMTIMK